MHVENGHVPLPLSWLPYIEIKGECSKLGNDSLFTWFYILFYCFQIVACILTFKGTVRQYGSHAITHYFIASKTITIQ